MAKKNAPLTARCIMGVACPVHGFIHGGEAEELREKLEKLSGDDAYVGDDDYDTGRLDAAAEIRRVLDDVDARDSVAYLENVAEDQEYYILSLQNSQTEVLLWWKPNAMGYTVFLEQAGRYPKAEVAAAENRYDNGETTLAIPCEAAERRAHLMVHDEDLRELKAQHPPLGKP